MSLVLNTLVLLTLLKMGDQLKRYLDNRLPLKLGQGTFCGLSEFSFLSRPEFLLVKMAGLPDLCSFSAILQAANDRTDCRTLSWRGPLSPEESNSHSGLEPPDRMLQL